MSLDRRAALVIAHPGHELRVYNWLSLVHPIVFVLTDGSGRSQASRLHRTTSILDSLGARSGSIYGRLTDQEIYAAILNCDVDLFVSFAHELTTALLEHEIEYVVGDAIEGYNPAHDVCRLLINAAVRKAGQQGTHIDNFDVLLDYDRVAPPSVAMIDAVPIYADEETQARKLKAAREYSELEVDVNRILAAEGIDSLRAEYLRPANESYQLLPQELPYYEVYGAKQVAAGRYHNVIRYRDHILPIAKGLERFAESKGLALVADSNH